MPSVKVYENEHFERAIRRFKKAVETSGILTDLRERECYVKPSIKRKRAKASAKKRWERVSSSNVHAKRMY